jgi:hypothetical protein
VEGANGYHRGTYGSLRSTHDEVGVHTDEWEVRTNEKGSAHRWRAGLSYWATGGLRAGGQACLPIMPGTNQAYQTYSLNIL